MMKQDEVFYSTQFKPKARDCTRARKTDAAPIHWEVTVKGKRYKSS